MNHFNSELKRSSVIVKNNDQYNFLVKGAPEIMKELCLQDTLPEFFDQKIEVFNQQGYRVLVMAGKSLPKEMV